MVFFSLALTKSVGLRTDGRIDDRSFWINYVSSISTPLAVPLVYPRMISVHDLDAKVWCGYIQLISLFQALIFTLWETSDYSCFSIYQDDEGSVLPPSIPLSSEHISNEGIYFLENGEDGLLYVAESVDSGILQKLFGVPSAAEIPSQVISTSLAHEIVA